MIHKRIETHLCSNSSSPITFNLCLHPEIPADGRQQHSGNGRHIFQPPGTNDAYFRFLALPRLCHEPMPPSHTVNLRRQVRHRTRASHAFLPRCGHPDHRRRTELVPHFCPVRQFSLP